MMALLVAVLTASSALAALWPFVHLARTDMALHVTQRDGGPRDERPVVKRRQGCRRIAVIVRKPGEVTKGCSTARKRPCSVRRRW